MLKEYIKLAVEKTHSPAQKPPHIPYKQPFIFQCFGPQTFLNPQLLFDCFLQV